MSDAIAVAAIAAVPPTLMATLAMFQARSGKRESVATNVSINHQNEGEPSIMDRMRRVDDRTEGLVDEVTTITADVGELHQDLAGCARAIGRVDGKLDRHLAAHQAETEATEAARRGDIDRRGDG